MNDWRLRLEPALTPLFRAWWRLHRPVTLGVRALVTDEAGGVLLVRHTYAPGWHMPGGGVEHGETALDAVARELREEACIEAGGAALIGFYANHANFPNDHIALYRVETWRPCATARSGEIAAHGFFACDALPDGVTPGTLRRLAEAFEGAPLSANW